MSPTAHTKGPETIRLLVLNDSRSEVERLLSMLKNAGYPTRAQHVESEDALQKLLQDQSWDLLLGHDQCSQVSVSKAIQTIRALNKDVPVILICDEEGSQPVVNGLKLGARDVVRLDEDQHLLLVIQRELDSRTQRRQRRTADQKLREAERRSQQLLDSSRDAIAFVQDGMYSYANQSFAELFQYQDRDEIECMPVMDLVSPDDQSAVKQFLKEFTFKGEEAELSQLSIEALCASGEHTPVTIDVARAIFDEEPCIQFLIRAKTADADNEQLQAELDEVKTRDLSSGVFNRNYLMQELEKVTAEAYEKSTVSSLLHIELDNFQSHIVNAMGAAATDNVMHSFANALQPLVQPGQTLARLSDHSFALLAPSASASQALAQAEQLCQAVAKHIVDINGQTVQTTCTIGIANISEASENAQQTIEEAHTAISQWQAANDNKGNGAHVFEPDLSNDEAMAAKIAQQVQLALKKNRFRLLFQPIIGLRSSNEEIYEVFLRMVSTEDDNISPSDFLKTATDLGAMAKIDRWVILEAIKSLGVHRANGNNTRLIINLSKDSLVDESLVPWLKVAFKAAELSSDAVVFQVDETDVTNHLTAAKQFFNALAEIGCKSGISNFGCALNPFQTLEHAPADFVKVHGSFTQDIQQNDEDPDTLKGLIHELQQANKLTIVPFVENASILATLWQTGVHYIQGYYLQAPTDSMSYDFNME